MHRSSFSTGISYLTVLRCDKIFNDTDAHTLVNSKVCLDFLRESSGNNQSNNQLLVFEKNQNIYGIYLYEVSVNINTIVQLYQSDHQEILNDVETMVQYISSHIKATTLCVALTNLIHYKLFFYTPINISDQCKSGGYFQQTSKTQTTVMGRSLGTFFDEYRLDFLFDDNYNLRKVNVTNGASVTNGVASVASDVSNASRAVSSTSYFSPQIDNPKSPTDSFLNGGSSSSPFAWMDKYKTSVTSEASGASGVNSANSTTRSSFKLFPSLDVSNTFSNNSKNIWNTSSFFKK